MAKASGEEVAATKTVINPVAAQSPQLMHGLQLPKSGHTNDTADIEVVAKSSNRRVGCIILCVHCSLQRWLCVH